METFQTPRRSFLTGVEEFSRPFAAEKDFSPYPVATLGTHRGGILQEHLTYFWNFSLVSESHGVSSGASFDDMAGSLDGGRAVWLMGAPSRS